MPIRPPCNENKEKESHGNEWHPDNICYPSFHIFSPNVTVQGTRHLVEGTLEPIVRILSIIGMIHKGNK